MTNTSKPSAQDFRFFPALDDARTVLDAPVTQVTLLEDRAQITRVGTCKLSKGRNRLMVREVSPILQDVSLRAELTTGEGSVVDTRARRALRAHISDKPKDLQALEEKIAQGQRAFAHHQENRRRHEERYQELLSMLHQSSREFPQDAAWSIANPQVWHDTFDTLSTRLRKLLEDALQEHAAQKASAGELDQLAILRRSMDRPDTKLIAVIEVDIDLPKSEDVEVSFTYVVPNALWRPMHSARLTGTQLTFESHAVVWQNTGEDWTDASFQFSTARSSLGVQAPLLSDDLLHAQRKAEEVRIEQREVSVQDLGPDSDAAPSPPPTSIELPGVDDGGEIQNLHAADPATIPSDGRPCIIPLFSFDADADVSLVCMPELQQKVFCKSIQTNNAPHPLLAGPVELIRDHGFVGWSNILFVAPQAPFVIGYGPDDGIRLTRTHSTKSKSDHVDQWQHTSHFTKVYLSNLEDTDKSIELTERIPVSEIEHVKVQLIDQKTSPTPTLDDNGFCKWTLTLPPHERQSVKLCWKLSVAPGVKGL